MFLLFMDCLCVRLGTPTIETYNHGEAQDGKSNDEEHTDILEIKDFRSTVLDVRCFCFFSS